MGLRLLAQAGRACWGLLAPCMPPPALLKILCRVFSGQSLPQVQRGLPSCTSPRGGDSSESQPRPLSLWQLCLTTPGGLAVQTWALPPLVAGARSSPLWLLQGRVACPSSPPRHPPIQLRHLFFPWRHCPPSRETESSGGNRFRRLQWGGGETPQDQAGRGCLWGPLCLLGRAGSQPRRPALAGRGSPRLVPAGPGPPAAPAAAPPAAGSAPHPEQAGPGDGGGGHS